MKDKIKSLLLKTNFITIIELRINNITQQMMDEFCSKYKVEYKTSSRVGGIIFTKDGEMVTDFKYIFNEQKRAKK